MIVPLRTWVIAFIQLLYPETNAAKWLFLKKKPPFTKLVSVCVLENCTRTEFQAARGFSPSRHVGGINRAFGLDDLIDFVAGTKVPACPKARFSEASVPRVIVDPTDKDYFPPADSYYLGWRAEGMAKNCR
jgi:hypothetical protein